MASTFEKPKSAKSWKVNQHLPDEGVTGISARHMMVMVGQSPASLKIFLHNIFSKAVQGQNEHMSTIWVL
jgi:hypothetical protein